MNNNEKIKEILNSEPVPQELEPENIKKMLDEKAPVKKRSNISVTGRVIAAATACAVIGGGSYAYVSHNPIKRNNETITEETTKNESSTEQQISENELLSYMSGANDYSEIYSILKKSAEKYEDSYLFKTNKFMMDTETVVNEAVDEDYSDSYAETALPSAGQGENNGFGGDDSAEDEISHQYSDTYNQEENVLEADIVKTDGEFIYYITNNYYEDIGETPLLRTAEVENGKFYGAWTLDFTDYAVSLCESNANYSSVSIQDMYLYNDMLAIIGTAYSTQYNNDYYSTDEKTFVVFCTTGAEPEIIDCYLQDGYYNDVRIAPDGFMYLVTDYTSYAFSVLKNEDDYEKYIPECGLSEKCGLIPPQNILLPTSEPRENPYLSYSIIGSVDLNTSGQPIACECKALADYSGTMYTSANNIYTACEKYSTEYIQKTGTNPTDITRIAIGNGTITPVASGTIDGYVNDQFSMSEYDGYFRIAVTRNKYSLHTYDNNQKWWKDIFISDDESSYYTYEGRDNCVYVLDLDMNVVGSIDNFGIDESVKSVSFSGNMAYVVTYRQTDPLFAIDLSDPTSPVIVDELKINGYSTYMQKWTDGLLLGFGIDADDNGIETGIKLVMFDNSDPENLREVGKYSLNCTQDNWISSNAIYDRKALLIAPEKNLIGFPISIIDYDNYYGEDSEYVFFKYENGEFITMGEFYGENNGYSSDFDMLKRALYIDEYVYILSGKKFISAEMDTMNVSAELDFSNIQLSEKEIVTTTVSETTTVTTTETTETETTETETTEIVTTETTVATINE